MGKQSAAKDRIRATGVVRNLEDSAKTTQAFARQRAVETTLKKDARIGIRLSTTDLRSLQVRALQEGTPFLNLVSTILHKFVTGQLVEKNDTGAKQSIGRM